MIFLHFYAINQYMLLSSMQLTSIACTMKVTNSQSSGTPRDLVWVVTFLGIKTRCNSLALKLDLVRQHSGSMVCFITNIAYRQYTCGVSKQPMRQSSYHAYLYLLQ